MKKPQPRKPTGNPSTNPPRSPAPQRGRPRSPRVAQDDPQPQPTTTTTTSAGSTTDEELRKALAAVQDPQERKEGEAEAAAGDGSTAEHDDEASPLLSPEELVEITESICGLALSAYAVFTGRDMPEETQLEMRGGTRKLLLLTAPGTMQALGESLQENRDALRSLSPLGYALATAGHLFEKVRAVRRDMPSLATPVAAPWVQPPVSSVPLNKRTDVWLPPTAAPQAAAPGEANPERAKKFAAPPGITFGRKKMPKLEMYDGNGPIVPAQTHTR